MTLNELYHMLIESARNNMIVDDERIDPRLVYDWIDLKRAQFIKNQRSNNPNDRVNLNIYQSQPFTVEVVNVTDAGDYPYTDNTTQLYKIVQSTTDIPNILDKNGPIILSLESQDLMKLPFSVVDYDHLRVAGNGKFNTSLIYGAVRDNKVYFKYNQFFDTYTNVILRAVFENPRDVTGFTEESRYPLNADMLEYVKNAIYEKEFRIILSGESDEESNASGLIK